VHDQDLPAALTADVDGSFEHLVLAFQNALYAFAALGLGPRCGRWVFRRPCFEKQRTALGIGGTTAVRLAKKPGAPYPFVGVPPVCSRYLPGREDPVVSRISGRERAHA